jgi:outer membrane protein assembly factor BamB
MVVDAKARGEAKEIIAEAGIKGGLVVHLGCGDGTQTAALRVNDRYLVHGLDSDRQKVAAARRDIQARGLYGTVSVDVWEGKVLPYADNLVNLIVMDDQKVSGVSVQVSGREIERVLAPGGVALLPKGFRFQVSGLRSQSSGQWTKTTKPWPKEMGEWTHYRQGPGNNPVTPDTRVGPPRSLQWRCEPLWVRSHAFTTSFTAMVTAQGRVFYILDDAPTGIAQDAVPEQWTLVARDAFNGILLWKKPLSPWGVAAWKNGALRYSPKAGEECLVAYKDRVMMTLGFQSEVSILDAATGRILGVCEGTDGIEEMRCENDILVVNKAGKGLMAFDARNARPLWKVDARIFNMMINSDRVMYFDQTIKKIVCLRLKDGAPLWESSAVKPRSILTHGDYVVLGPSLQVLSVETGKLLWANGENVSRGMFVSQGQIWTMSKNDKHVFGFDLVTGEKRTVVDTEDFYSAGHHPRCHPVKASANYLITANRGSEFISLTGGEHIPNDWVRGACKYGIMPGNGMFYAPPDPCFCFPNQSVKGLNALAPAARIPLLPMPEEERLQRGSAYDTQPSSLIPHPSEDWPMYRRDPKRSGVTPGEVTPQLEPQWEVELRAPLTPPVSGGGKVYVAAKDEHTVYALDSGSGREVWRYTAGGRIDSPPVIDGPRILFGCADGYAYCLRAKDGALVWRFQAAPARRLICDKGQLESPWRVHGSMLLLDGVVYLTAGRSSFLDGGIWIFGLDAGTGAIRYQTHLDTTMKRRDDAKGKPFTPAHHIEGTQSDLLVSQDGSIYLGQFRFDKRLVRQEVPYLKPAPQEVSPEVLHSNLKPGREPVAAKNAKKSPLKKYFSVSGAYMAMTHPGMLEKYLEEFGGLTWGEQRVGLHLTATHGFLENDSFNRAFWSYSDIRLGFNMNLFNRDARCGELMVITPERTFLVRGHPVPARTKTFKPGTEGYLLAAMSNPGPTTGEDALVPLQVDKRALSQKLSESSPIWSHQLPLRIRSMVLAGETLFVAGVPDVADPADPRVAQAALDGRKGAQLQAYSASDGRKLAEYELTAPPVFDGLIAAGGRLYYSTTDGKVICMAGQPRQERKREGK